MAYRTTWTAVDIGGAGERAVVAWLRMKGWRIDVWNTQSPGATDIQASSGGKTILVQVKAAISPAEPPSLTVTDLSAIKSRAARIGAEAWLAKVKLDGQSLAPVSNVNWLKISD